MLIELIAAPFVVAYVLIVALGHVLLVAAIYKCLREDYSGGRGRKAVADHMTIIEGGIKRAVRPVYFKTAFKPQKPNAGSVGRLVR